MNLKKRLKTMVPQIDTTADRVHVLKIILIGTTIVAGISLVSLIQSPAPYHSVRGKQYTDTEYQQLKTAEISLIANRKSALPTFEEAEIWKEIVSVGCKNIILHNVTSGTIIDQLNNYLSNGCKE